MALAKRQTLNRVLVILLLIAGSACARGPVQAVAPDDFQYFIFSEGHHQTLKNFERTLRASHVDNVIPTHQLLRQGSDWKNNRLPQYAFPAAELWPEMITTLKFMQRFIIPSIGPVEVLSGFRTPLYNRKAGGAPKSKHLLFSAIDLRPKSTISRQDLHKRLLHIWRIHGKGLHLGLGLYSGTRFHIDTGGYRKW